jgi:sulfur carrier protein
MPPEIMQVVLNGKTQTLDKPLTVAQLVDSLALEGKLAVEINQEIIPRGRYDETRINDGDCIEVVRAVGGG